MNKTPVIAIFDIGKTNKKLLLFDRDYDIVYEESRKFDEIKDEDGFPCEDVTRLTEWVRETFNRILSDERFDVKAVNFAAYGASFVYLDDKGEVTAPLYNYLRPYPKKLRDEFYKTYGGESIIAKETCSPVLGSLNSGMQLYRLKYEKRALFKKISYALHLPQYLSYILSSKFNTDITSIGCHTNIWHFGQNKYHRWVEQEGLLEKFPPLISCTEVVARIPSASLTPLQMERGKPPANAPFSILEKDRDEDFNNENTIFVSAGLHDSSAALIPYLSTFREPFILLSTGTWCISLHPFNQSPLTDEELDQDCLCYLSYQGKPVKASRLFAGYEHEQQVKRLAEYFNKPSGYYITVSADPELLRKAKQIATEQKKKRGTVPVQPAFAGRDLGDFKHYEEAYHQLMADLMVRQVQSTSLVLSGSPVKKIFVDGGFANNSIYMQLLALSFPETEVYAAYVAQSTALGAALLIHSAWNPHPLPADLVKLQRYEAGAF